MKRLEWDGDARAASCYQRLQGAQKSISVFLPLASNRLSQRQKEVSGCSCCSQRLLHSFFPLDQLFNIHKRLNGLSWLLMFLSQSQADPLVQFLQLENH